MQGFKHTGWLRAFTTGQTNNKRNLKRCNVISQERETSVSQRIDTFHRNPIATCVVIALNLHASISKPLFNQLHRGLTVNSKGMGYPLYPGYRLHPAGSCCEVTGEMR